MCRDSDPRAPSDPELCAFGDIRLTIVDDHEGDRSRYCSNSAWRLTQMDGPGQDSWISADDDDGTGGVEGGDDLGISEGEIEGQPPNSASTASSLQVPHCGRNTRKTGGFILPGQGPLSPPGFSHVWTFRIKFGRMGVTRGGDPYRQYHIHWQVTPPFWGNSARTFLSVRRVLPHGVFDPSPFDDSDTRRLRPDPNDWKPYYAHFLRLRVKPFSEIGWFARTQWTNPYSFPTPAGTIRYAGHRYYGACTAHLR